MSRLASVLGVLVGVLLTAATALYPCLPAREPSGEVFALSRFDYALVYLAQPETIWAQWTNNGPWDLRGIRIHAVLPFAFQLAAISLVGLSLVVPIRSYQKGSRLSTLSLAYIVGYVLCRCLHYPQWAVMKQVTTAGNVTLILLIVGVSLGIGRFHRERTSRRMTLLEPKPDDSLDQSWKRRLMGLFVIGLVAVGLLQVLGAMLPSVDEGVRMGTWWQTIHANEKTSGTFVPSSWTDFDGLAHFWIDLTNTNWRANIETDAWLNGQSLGTPAHYPVLISSKLTLFGALVAGHCLLWCACRKYMGKLPSLVTLFLLVVTPALVELSRFGRHECLVYAGLAGIVFLISTRSFQDRRMWIVIGVCAIPLLEHMFTVARLPKNEQELWIDPIMRFLGFSSLYSVPFVACVVLGAIVRRTRTIAGLVVMGCLLFLLIGLIASKSDRSWVPSIALLAIPMAFGVDWLLDHQTRWVGLPMWGSILVLSIVNVAVWPTMENRILAPASMLIAERWDSVDVSTTSPSTTASYVKEIRRQFVSGAITSDSRVGLLGATDDLDLPIDCLLIDTSMMQNERWRDHPLTHLALVSPQDGNRRLIPLETELEIRTQLQKLVAAGYLKAELVSDDCFELSLFAVRR
jgi:hypothetical protein